VRVDGSEFSVLSEGKRVYHADPKVPHRVLDLAMRKQKLDGPEVAGRSQPAVLIEVESDVPYLVRFQCTLRADSSSGIPGWTLRGGGAASDTHMIVLELPERPRKNASGLTV